MFHKDEIIFGNPTDWKADNNLEISARYGEDVSDQWNDEKHSKKKWATTLAGARIIQIFPICQQKICLCMDLKKRRLRYRILYRNDRWKD